MDNNSGIVLNSLRDILYVVFRHKWAIFVVFVLTAVAVTGVTFALPQVYLSEAKVLLRLGRENLPGDPKVQGAMVNVNQDRTAEVKSEITILQSADIAEKVLDEVGEAWILGKKELGPKDVEDFGPWPADSFIKSIAGTLSDTAKETLITLKLRERLTPRQEALKRIQASLSAVNPKQTNNIEVAFEHKNPNVAKGVLSRIMSYYYAKHVEVFRSDQDKNFLEGKTRDLNSRLTEAESNLEAFRATNNISQIDTQIEVLLGRIADLEGNIATTEAETKGLEALVTNLQGSLSKRSRMHETARTSGMVNYASDTIKEELIKLRKEEADLSNRYPDTHRPLVETRDKIRVMDELLKKEKEYRTEVTTQLDRNYEGLEHTVLNETSQIAARRARHVELTAEVERLRGQLVSLSAQQTELTRLERELDLVQREYTKSREKLEEAILSDALDLQNISNVSEVQPASDPIEPIRPKKARNIGLGLLLGLFLGLCYAFLLEFLDDSLNTVEGAEKALGKPVLAALSVDEYKSCI